MSYMGIDIGTSGTKAVTFDDGGRLLAQAYREYATLMPAPGHAELDSKAVMDACLEVVAAAAAATPAADPVRSIGVSCQGEAFTVLAADGTYLSNGMVSFDTRAAGLARTWSREFGEAELYARTGHTPHPMFSIFKILWVRDHLPEVWRRAARFYCFEELFHHRLGVEPAVNWSLAARTMLFNVSAHDWDDGIMAAVGLRRSQFARVLPSGAVVGRIPAAMARSLGLAPDAVVIAGGHDQPAGALGAGVTEPGKAVYGMGTVDCICPAFAKPVFSPELCRSNLCTYDFTLPGMYTTVAFSLTGGNLLRWYRDQWGAAEAAAAAPGGAGVYELILRGLPAEPTDLLVLPYFTPTGTPYFDADAGGAILGLKLNTTRGEVLRALLEGVALEMKLNVQILEQAGCGIREFIAIGGGSRDQAVLQLKADVLNRPITTVAVAEAGCLAMAILGHAALAGEIPAAVASRWARPLAVVAPRPAAAAAYEARFAAYRELYPRLGKLRTPLLFGN